MMKCLLCSRDLTGKEKSVTCRYCTKTFHATCMGVTGDDLELMRDKSASVKCSICIKSGVRSPKSFVSVSSNPSEISGRSAGSSVSDKDRLPKNACHHCQKSCSKYTDNLKCSTCNKWSHIQCLGITVAQYEAIRRRSEGVEGWYCGLCRGGPADFTFETLDSSSQAVGNAVLSLTRDSADSPTHETSGNLSPCDKCSALFDYFSTAITNMEKKIMENLESLRRDFTSGFQTALQSNLDELPKRIHENLRNVVDGQRGLPSTCSSMNYAKAVSAKASVIIKPKDESQSNTVTKADLLQGVNPIASGVSLSKVKTIKGGGLVIACNTAESADKLRNEAGAKLSEKYTVRDAKSICPRIKIVGVTEEHDSETLVNFLRVQNENLFPTNAKLEVVSFEALKSKNGGERSRRRRRVYQCTVEVDIGSYRNALSYGQVFVGYDSCSVYDAVEVTRCFNCSGFNHTSSSCKQKIACPRCAGEHKVSDCKSETLKCINCFSLRKTSPDIVYSHAAWDRGCKVYQHKLKLFKADVLNLE